MARKRKTVRQIEAEKEVLRLGETIESLQEKVEDIYDGKWPVHPVREREAFTLGGLIDKGYARQDDLRREIAELELARGSGAPRTLQKSVVQ